MIVATAGHIDHGKTSLVRALTGIDADRLPEEKRRGMTIDLGFAYEQLGDGAVLGFVDVPGHERFVRNMLAGVTGIDLALLVVAADDGPMPQTREHFAIMQLLGVDRGAVALTKTDRVPDSRRVAAEAEIARMLEGTAFAGAPLFPVSSTTGSGIPELRRFLLESVAATPRRPVRGLFRQTVDRCFSVQGAGVVVTGTVLSGSVRAGDDLILAPLGIPVRVRGVHADNVQAEAGHVGQRCAINITGHGLHTNVVHRGDVLLAPALHQPTQRIDARVRLMPGEGPALKERTPVHLHIGATDVTGRFVPLEGRSLARGESGFAQIVLDRQINALHGDRFVLRDQSAQDTIGGGVVVDPFPPARGRKTTPRLSALRAMEAPDPAVALERLLEIAPAGIDVPSFWRNWNLDAADQADLWRRVPLVRAGDPDSLRGFAPDAWDKLQQEMLRIVGAWHATSPDSTGIEPDRLRRLIAVRLTGDVFASLVQTMVSAGTLGRSGVVLHLPEHKAAFVGPDNALWNRVSETLVENGLKPPRIREIADLLDLDHRKIENLLRRAVGMGYVFRVAENRYFPPETIRELAIIAEEVAKHQAGGTFTAVDYKDRVGIGRNVTIQLLEFFDSRGFTRRDGDVRRIARPATEVFGASDNA